MKNSLQYEIKHQSLALGKHVFSYTLNDEFFDSFEFSEIKHAEISVNVELVKSSKMLDLSFSLSGWIEVDCDRCMEEFKLSLNETYNLVVKFGDTTEEETDELVIFPESNTALSVEQYLYEFAHLSLPVKRVHPDDANGQCTCNKEVLKLLAQLAPKEAENKEEKMDPRWELLKNLNMDN